MPRPRQKALFELDGQWIGREVGKPFLYRYWHDAATGHSRRASLGTADIGEAKRRLAEIVVKGAPKNDDSALSIVLENYFTERTDHLPSAKPARHAGRLALKCWGALVTVGGVTEEKNKKFVRDGLKAGHAISYIARNLGVVAAAITHAKLPCRLVYTEGAILAKWPEFKPKPARQIFEPTDEQLAKLLKAQMPKNLRRWLLMAMATGGRPEALLDLAPAARQRELGLIDLNPEGRRQNKKYRPTIREIPSLTRLLNQWEREDEAERKKRKRMPANYCRYASTDSLDTALHRLREDVDLPQFSAYSLRHRVASVLRAGKVPGDQISFWMGHRRVSVRSEARTTRGYGQFDADYLTEAAEIMEAWVARILAMAQVKAVKKLRRAA